MTGIPTFATPPAFLGLRRHDHGADLTIAGIPLDIGVTNRPGARFGPQAIRHASRMLVDGAHPQSWVDPATLSLSDIGDFAVALGDLPESLRLIEQQAAACAHLLALGGEHGITLPLLRALARRLGGPVGLVAFRCACRHLAGQLRARPSATARHSTMRSGRAWSIRTAWCRSASARRCSARCGTGRWGRGVTILTAQDVHEIGPAVVADRIRAVVGTSGTYLSFDIDVLDPSAAPGTGTPEVGGLASWQMQAILRRLRGMQFVGMDVVEVAPAYDIAEITSLAAATVAWEYLALLGSDQP